MATSGEFFVVVLVKNYYKHNNFFIQIKVGRWTEDNGHRRRVIYYNGFEDIGDDWAKEEGNGE